MKIAKKVLAVVMAVAMIAALSAMAFAADGAKIVLKAGEVADGYMPITIALKNGLGAKSIKVDLEYDKAVFAFEYDEDAEDASALLNTKTNAKNISAVNGEEAGKIQYGYAFAKELVSAADFAKDAKPGKTVEVNSDEFSFTTLYFKVLDDKASASDIKISADIDGVKTTDTASIKLKDEAPVETQPVEVATTVEADTKASNPPTGDKTTGDNMALAAAAGVVVLAGAAFIISKKRK